MRREVILGLFLIANGAPALADDGVIIIAESKPFVATSAAPQRTCEFIDIPKGQDKLQMTLTYYNGSETAPGFQRLQIQSPSMNYVTTASFQGKNSCSRDVTNELAWGGNQILIYGQGPKGATMNWRLTAPKPVVTGISPQTVNSNGFITISGTNFCPEADENIIVINGKTVPCTSATPTALIAKIPSDTQSGSIVVDVKTAGIAAGQARVTVSAAPYMTSLSSAFVPPGQNCTIYGANFGSSINNVSLYMGPVQCPVNSVSNDQITFMVPGAFGGEPWGVHQPLRLAINNVKSRNTLFLSAYELSVY
ncbi:MAG TPA: IPT/TIG domain-containing protein [Drouetiella sp.]